MDSPRQKLSLFGHSIAAGAASITTTLFTYPLDLIRTRFQVHDGKRTDMVKYRGIIHAMRQISATEGIKGLYSGISASLFGSGVSWAMYMLIYTATKEKFESKSYKGTPSVMISGVVAGATTSLVTNPIWVIKTRLQTQIAERGQGPKLPTHYAGAIDAARKIFLLEGPAAFSRGIVPAVLASYHGAVQLTIYELAFGWMQTGAMRISSGPASFIAGGTSKVGAMLLTHPLAVAKSRLQEQREAVRYLGFVDCLHKTWRNEGIVGLYKGMTPSLARLVLTSGLFFFLFEEAKKTLVTSELLMTRKTWDTETAFACSLAADNLRDHTEYRTNSAKIAVSVGRLVNSVERRGVTVRPGLDWPKFSPSDQPFDSLE